MGSTYNPIFGTSNNPWDLERLPGGSSGGSAAAVAARLVHGALGTDTGGSVRQPAALCGLVGLRPTHAAINPQGLFPSVASCDTIGPMARTVEDTHLLWSVMSGRQPHDLLQEGASKLRVAVPRSITAESLGLELERAYAAALDTFQRLGSTLVYVPMIDFGLATSTYQVLAAAGAAQSLAQFYGLRGNFATPLQKRLAQANWGERVVKRVQAGLTYLFGDRRPALEEARQLRASIKEQLETLLKSGIDLIVLPTSPVAALTPEEVLDAAGPERWDRFTIPAALAGLPALSLPCGHTRAGLPIDLQLMSAEDQERTLFNAAYAYEQNTVWHRRQPPQLTSDQAGSS